MNLDMLRNRLAARLRDLATLFDGRDFRDVYCEGIDVGRMLGRTQECCVDGCSRPADICGVHAREAGK